MSVAGVGVPAFRMFDGERRLAHFDLCGRVGSADQNPCNVAQRVGGNVGECRRMQERRSSSNSFVAVPTASSVLEPPGSINSRTMLSPVVLLLRVFCHGEAFPLQICHGGAQKNVA